MSTYKSLSRVKNLSSSQTRRLKELLKTQPRQSEIVAFLDSCQVAETSPTSTVEKILNSQLRAALRLMPVSDLTKSSGVN